MPLVARASNTVRNKNLLIILMCAGFVAWFGYDGFVGWPENNDRLVTYAKSKLVPMGVFDPDDAAHLETWHGWTNEDAAGRQRLDDFVHKYNGRLEGWKTINDIALQRWIVAGLAVATVGAIWWFIHCQRRRAIADETTVSPSPGVEIPWDKIRVVDNNRWKKMGIVDITYLDGQGKERQAKFDDYQLDREPLLSILDQLAEKAVNAEFIPKEEPPSEAPPPPAGTAAGA